MDLEGVRGSLMSCAELWVCSRELISIGGAESSLVLSLGAPLDALSVGDSESVSLSPDAAKSSLPFSMLDPLTARLIQTPAAVNRRQPLTQLSLLTSAGLHTTAMGWRAWQCEKLQLFGWKNLFKKSQHSGDIYTNSAFKPQWDGKLVVAYRLWGAEPV